MLLSLKILSNTYCGVQAFPGVLSSVFVLSAIAFLLSLRRWFIWLRLKPSCGNQVRWCTEYYIHVCIDYIGDSIKLSNLSSWVGSCIFMYE